MGVNCSNFITFLEDDETISLTKPTFFFTMHPCDFARYTQGHQAGGLSGLQSPS